MRYIGMVTIVSSSSYPMAVIIDGRTRVTKAHPKSHWRVDEQLVIFHSVLLGAIMTSESPIRVAHKRITRGPIPGERLIVGVGGEEDETVVGVGSEEDEIVVGLELEISPGREL